MKPIVGLYIEMLRQTGYTTIKQCKARISKEDLRHFRIPLEQHKTRYLYQALEHISKTPSKAKFSISERITDLYRRRELVRIDQRLSQLPDGNHKGSLQSTRNLIESQIIPASGMA